MLVGGRSAATQSMMRSGGDDALSEHFGAVRAGSQITCRQPSLWKRARPVATSATISTHSPTSSHPVQHIAPGLFTQGRQL